MKKIFTLLFLTALVCVKGWGQTSATATWPLTSNANATVTGNVTAPAFTAGSGLTLSSYSSSYGIGYTGFNNSGFGVSNTSDYYQFAVAPASGNGLNVTTFNITASATNNTYGGFGNGSVAYEIDYYVSSSGTGSDNNFYNNSSTYATTYYLRGNATNQTNSYTFSSPVNVPAGSTLYIRVYPYGGANYNTIFYAENVAINGTTYTPPANDLCSNATPISAIGAPGLTGTTLGATVSNSTSAIGDVWYQFTVCGATGRNPTANVSVSSATNQNLDVFVFTTSCPNINNYYASQYPFDEGNTPSTGNFSVSSGTYYIRVAQYSGTSGNFTITLTTSSGVTIATPATFTLVSGSATTTVCASTLLTPIKYTVGNYTGAPTVTGLPTGVSGSLTGNTFTISGTPTTAGTYNYTVTANSGSCSSAITGTTTGTITVNANAFIALTSAASTTSQTPCVNTAITNITYQTSGSATGASITAGSLPTGITGAYSSGTGVYTISGTPTVNGTFNYTVTTSGGGCQQQSLTGTITVKPNSFIALTSATGTDAQTPCVNTAITNITYLTSGSATGASITAGSLPTGVTGTYNNTNSIFTISGTPTVSGTFNYTVTTSGGGCQQQSLTGTITVKPNSFITYQSGNATTQTPCVNTAITNIVYTTSGGTTGINSSGLPPGVTAVYNAGTVTVSGTPTQDGTFNYTLTTTGGGCTQQSVSGTITAKANAFIALTSAASTTSQTPCAGTAITNITYQTTGSATGVSLTWKDNNNNTISTPAGINSSYSGSTFTISGTPTVSGTYNYTVTTTGGSCSQQSLTGTITVNANGFISLTSNANTTSQTLCAGTAITNITYQTTGSATGVTATGLPNGLTKNYNSSTGVYTISGIPSQSGPFNYTLTTSGGSCTQQSVTGTITVNALSTAQFNQLSFTTCTAQPVQLNITGTPSTSVAYQSTNGNSSVPLDGSGNGHITTTNLQPGANTYTLTTVTGGSNTCAANISGNMNTTATVNAQQTPTVTAITVPSGGAYVQVNNSLQLSDAPPANTTGAWSTSSASQATIDNTGKVTGVTASTPTITYTATNTTGSQHCTNTATQVVRVYNPDYVTKSAIVNFSDNNWQINRGDNTYIDAPSAPSATNTGYTSITIQNPLNMDVDFPLPSGKTFTIANGGTMTILPNKTFSSQGTVDFGNNPVTVKSDATGTGAIGQITGGTIANATKVTAERYIGSAVAPSGKRAWRLIAAPVTNTTINGAWQEGLVANTTSPAVGNTTYGTLITGQAQGSAANASANGFDFWPAIAGNTTSSIRYYNPANGGTWASYSSIKNVAVNSQPAYMLFVRGNRAVQSGGYPYSITTLRATGTLNQGSVQTITVDQTKANAVAGNPFASTIDFSQVHGANSGLIQDKFAIWRANQGSYGAYSLVYNTGNGYAMVPNALSGTNPAADTVRYIQSGEGFMVYPVAGSGTGTLTINEFAKTTSLHQANGTGSTFDVRPSTDAKLYVNLNLINSDSTATLADGVMERYDASYSAGIDGDDAQKQTNFNENLSIESVGTELIVEARPNVQKTDTVQLKLWNVNFRQYQLQLKGDNFAAAASQGLHAYVEDSYLKTRQEVSLSGSISTIAFAVTSDAASYDSHRFRVVFQTEASVLPITLTSVKAVLQNSGVSVSWTTQNEVNVREYVVERSVDGGATFATTIATVGAKNNGATTPLASYASFDAAPKKGDNYYRIRIEGADGKVTYSGVVKVTVGEDVSGKTLITLYPNPVSRKEGKAWLSLQNVKEGDYLLSVYSQSGQSIVEKKITVASGSRSQNESVPLPQSLAQGNYQLQLTDLNGNKVFTSKFIVGK